jgi:hypothetical protein
MVLKDALPSNALLCYRHYCTITLTVKSRDNGPISHAANLNKRSKTEYRQANEPQIQNEQKNDLQ